MRARLYSWVSPRGPPKTLLVLVFQDLECPPSELRNLQDDRGGGADSAGTSALNLRGCESLSDTAGLLEEGERIEVMFRIASSLLRDS